MKLKSFFAISASLLFIGIAAISCSKEDSKDENSNAMLKSTTTYRGLYGSDHTLAGEISVVDNGSGTLTMTRSSVTPASTDRSALYSPYLALSGSTTTVPNNGKTYWAVYIDKGHDPHVIPGGSTLEVKCRCEDQIYVPGSIISDCTPDWVNLGGIKCGLSGCALSEKCVLNYPFSHVGHQSSKGSMLIAEADLLILDGLTYTP